MPGYNKIVNPQITDSVTETNTMVVGVTPSQIMTNLMQMGAHVNGLSMQNAAVGQKQTNMIADASTTQGLSVLYNVSTSVDAQGVDTVNRSNDMSKIIDALAIGDTLKTSVQSQYGG